MRQQREGGTRRLPRTTSALFGLCLLCLGILSCLALRRHDARQESASGSGRPALAQFRCADANVSLAQWQAEQADRGYPLDVRSTWIAPVTEPERAVALLVHGLNLRPDKMNPLAHTLAQQGIRVLRLTLHGHSCHNMHEFRHVEAADWFYDILRAYCIVATYAGQHALPLYYVGYSLGGSLVAEVLQKPWAERLTFEAMVLFAPGIALRSGPAALSRAVPLLMHLPWIRDLTPHSKNLPDYACHPGTPLQAYYAERQATAGLRRRGLTGVAHLPTMIFLDPDDELISWQETRKLLREAGLQRWSLRSVRKSPGHLPAAPHHLLIDEHVVGPAQWQTLSAQMFQHLSATPRAR